MDHLQKALSQQLVFDSRTVMTPGSMLERMQAVVMVGLVASVVFAVLTSMAAVISAIGAGGWIFSTKPITPQFNRLNPHHGLHQPVCEAAVGQRGQDGAHDVHPGFCGLEVHGQQHREHCDAGIAPSTSAIRAMAEWLTTGVSMLLLVVFLAALIDIPLQAFFFKVSTQNVPRRSQERTQGSRRRPHTKGRIRQKQRELADRASVGAVPKADFVVMNPTHYAVALKYDEATMSAPR